MKFKASKSSQKNNEFCRKAFSTDVDGMEYAVYNFTDARTDQHTYE